MNSLQIDDLNARYLSGADTPTTIIDSVLREIETSADGIWITRLSREQVMEYEPCIRTLYTQ